MSNQRLHKLIAQAGVASLRKAEAMILEGRVKVNGETINTLGYMASHSDTISVDGMNIYGQTTFYYYLLNKPKNVLSTASDDRGRATVMDYVPKDVRLFPVGRLDKDTLGALILTNDGQFANLMTHPKYEVSKTYEAIILGTLTKAMSDKLTNGIMLDDGMTQPATINFTQFQKEKGTTIVSLTIHEGKNRIVRRMFEALNVNLVKLTRTHIGFLGLDGLPVGHVRVIKPFEVKKLKALVK
ncbi:MAG: rRNA pseudouridine synthase [Erysipelothrix sp.]|nr:rRNA pseudouridine synthase [Erysipelothrix sp.]